MNKSININLEDIINVNINKINSNINTSSLEKIYYFIKNLLFDNFFFVIIAYLFILPYLFRVNNNEIKFNSWMIIIIPVSLLIHYFAKLSYRRYTKSGNIIRTNDCLIDSNHIIFNKTIKSIENRKELLEKPLNEFLINTSHNSYIPCTQNADVTSTEAIKRVLAMGARVIELDCFAKNNIGKTDDDMTPIVVHGIERKEGDIFSTSYILFEDCIDIIATYGFLTSDPLIICLELNTNELVPVQRKMKEIIKQKLGNKLLDSEYKLQNIKDRKYFINEPIKNLLNKVIFISGSGVTDELKDIIDGTFNENNILKNSSSNNEILLNKNISNVIHRVYPSGDLLGHLSLNFDPIPFWKRNYQLIALNFQMVDENLMKNVAMFKDYSFVHKSEIN